MKSAIMSAAIITSVFLPHVGNTETIGKPEFEAPFISSRTDLLLAAHSCEGDFDQDSIPDVIVIGSGLVFMRGTGSGSFAPTHPMVNASGNSIACADVSGDGLLDVLLGSGERVGVFPGDGNGGFPSSGFVVPGSSGAVMEVSDLDGDGHLDLVSCTWRTLTVNYGLGGGLWGDVLGIVMHGPIIDVKLANLNNDGRPDLVVAQVSAGHPDSSGVGVLLATGLRSYAEPELYSTDNGAVFLVATDFTRDGRDDVVATTANGLLVSLANAGNGALAVTGGVACNGCMRPVRFDATLDGTPDIVVAAQTDGVLRVFEMDATGVITPADTIKTGAGPTHVAIIDANVDGLSDVVSLSSDAKALSTSLAVGDEFGLDRTFAAGGRPRRVVRADLNRDGVPDVVMLDGSSDRIVVRLGGAVHALHLPIISDLPLGTFDDLLLVDFNDDAISDVVVSDLTGDLLLVCVGDSTGHFALAQSVPCETPTAISVSDFNGDGIDDIAVGNTTGMFVYLADGGMFDAPVVTLWTLNPFAMVASDLNGDTFADALIVDWVAHTLRVFVGNGLGGGSLAGSFQVGRAPIAVAHENSLVAVVNGNDETCTVFTIDGLVLTKRGDFAVGVSPASVAIGRDEGGRNIIAVPNRSSSVSILRCDDAATFISKGDYGTGRFAGCAVVGLLNDDPLLDVLVGNETDGTLTPLYGSYDVTTGTTLVTGSAGNSRGVAEIVWDTGHCAGCEFRLARRDQDSGWQVIAVPLRGSNGVLVTRDREVVGGERYWYRLEDLTGTVVSSEVLVVVERVDVRILRARLVQGRAEIECDLGNLSMARFDLVDVTGRVVDTDRSDGGQGVIRFLSTSRISPGVYFMRLAWPGGSSSRKIALFQ